MFEDLRWRIERFPFLRPGWDERDGAPPTREAAVRALRVVDAFEANNLPAQASPTNAGTILLETRSSGLPHHRGLRQLCVEVSESGCYVWHGDESAYAATLDDAAQAIARYARRRPSSSSAALAP